MLGLCQDMARALGVEQLVTLTRIEGGLAFQAPGMALALLGDRVLVIRWTRPPGELSMLQDHLSRRLGDAFPIEGIRAVAAGHAAEHTTKPQELAVDRVLTDPLEPDHLREVNDENVIPTTAADEDDFGPGL